MQGEKELAIIRLSTAEMNELTHLEDEAHLLAPRNQAGSDFLARKDR